MADRLHRAQQRQSESEEELQVMNLQLQERGAALESRGLVIERMGLMAHRMQAARTDEEFAAIVRCFVPLILPGISGAIYTHNSSRNQLVRLAQWGEPLSIAEYFGPQECWALRLGQSHSASPEQPDVSCSHVGTERSAYHCEPLLAGGEVIGMLHLERPVDEQDRFRLTAVAEDVSSALVNHRLQRSLREQTIRDPLTGLFNRRYLEETLRMEVVRAARAKSPLTAIMCDVDHFKRFNDDYGHDAGDHVLQAVAAEMSNHFRDGDVICRFGGEEFTVIACGATPASLSPRVEKLRQAIAALNLRIGTRQLGSVSMSFGMAEFEEHMDRDGTTLMQAADEALYRAKREGRNRAVIAARLAA